MTARTCVAFIVLALLAQSPAGARSIEAQRDFPTAGVCYGRLYDAVHLRRYPEQVVKAMFLFGSSRSLLADRRLKDRIDPELALTMRIVMTDGRVTDGDLGCPETDGRITRCGRNASCSGDFSISRTDDGRLRIVNDNGDAQTKNSSARQAGFSLDGSCMSGGVRGLFIPPDAENRTFLLARMPMQACNASSSPP